MPESEIPLLQGNAITIVQNDLNSYKELIKVRTDPNRTAYVRDIIIEYDDTTSNPQFKAAINGTPYLKDIPIFGGAGVLSFGGDLRLSDVKDPIIVWVKKTAAGVAAGLNVACLVTGIQLQK